MNKDNNGLRVLIVEDNPGDYLLLKKTLQRTSVPVEHFYWAQSLAEVGPLLKENGVDIAFLDLSLGDSMGVDSFTTLNRQLPHVPIIVLSGLSDTKVALETISLGAQDYVVKGEFDEKLLAKSIQYSLERKKILEKLQESNERFEIVNKATLDVVWDWDFATGSLSLSSSVTKVLGYIEQEVSIDWFFERICPTDVDTVKQSIANSLEKGKKHWSAEFWFLVPDAEYRYIYSRGYVLVDNEGQPYRMIGAATDLTEKRKLEMELVRQQVERQKLITETTIRAQEKERNELAKELHDNINQVLATVKMFLNIAKEEESAREDLVHRSYYNITYAIEEIRKLSKSLVAPSLGDMGILEALEDLVEEINTTKKIRVELVFKNLGSKELDSNVELMLYRITQEQMNNVLKYAKAGRAVITLEIHPQNIYLSIADNGIGFDPSKKAKGIGLKNISNRVEFYSGKMDIHSLPGEGCTLKVSIPI
jgi:two-component system, NarL family, sensor histidine kinase UhpB